VIIERLKGEGFILQRYDAYGTNSIYIKLDYGLMHSIRISDHKGKNHLKYRYNIGTSITRTYETMDMSYPRYFYTVDDVHKMLDKIICRRLDMRQTYGINRYNMWTEQKKSESQGKRGFWEKAVLL
jgi:hypothetical protein